MNKIDIHKHLKKLTILVREMKGEGEALIFYINYVQPIKEYFKKINNKDD